MGEVDAATEGSETKPVEMEPCAICIEPFSKFKFQGFA